MFDLTTLDTLDLATLDAVKEKVAALIKTAKGTKADADKLAKDKAVADKTAEVAKLIADKVIAEGTKVIVTFKGAEREATVLKLTDKTFTFDLTEGKRFVKFAAFVRLADAE